MADLARSALEVVGADGDSETEWGAVPGLSSPSCHALGLLEMRMRRRGLHKFSALSTMLPGVMMARARMVGAVARAESEPMTSRRGLLASPLSRHMSSSSAVSLLVPGLAVSAETSSPSDSSSLPPLVILARLADRLVNVLAMLATLSLRITECADVRMRCSFRARTVIPGKGSTSRVHTSDSNASSRALSPRDGANIGTRPLVASRDCERLMLALTEDRASFSTLVLRIMTLHNGDLGLTVIALWMDILRAIPPRTIQRLKDSARLNTEYSPCFPKTVPRLFIFKKSKL